VRSLFQMLKLNVLHDLQAGFQDKSFIQMCLDQEFGQSHLQVLYYFMQFLLEKQNDI